MFPISVPSGTITIGKGDPENGGSTSSQSQLMLLSKLWLELFSYNKLYAHQAASPAL
ncbi:hypothetical protein VKT23_013648 [Stygiomarasmius scandens]|uniref:Uncharacterized protein n=1 Tax=Marasmiellus scandens TaxID=2682957 RepID=A0ABR1J4A2_9AGAR